MKLKAPENLSSKERICFYDCEENKRYYQYGTAGGWKKYAGNPVFGGVYETCFDVSLLLEHEGRVNRYLKCGFLGDRNVQSAIQKVQMEFTGRSRSLS